MVEKGCSRCVIWKEVAEDVVESFAVFRQVCEKKDGMAEPTCAKMNQWKQQGKPVKIVRMDNAGENLKWPRQQMARIGNST